METSLIKCTYIYQCRRDKVVLSNEFGRFMSLHLSQLNRILILHLSAKIQEGRKARLSNEAKSGVCLDIGMQVPENHTGLKFTLDDK